MRFDPQTGELVNASKVLETKVKARILLSDEEVEALKKQRKAEGKKGRCPKYKETEVSAKLHVTWDRKRAEKDSHDRELALEKLNRRIESGQVTSSLRKGCNKYLDSGSTQCESVINRILSKKGHD